MSLPNRCNYITRFFSFILLTDSELPFQILRGGLLASPFLIIRTVFGLLEVVFQNSATSPFSPVEGNAVAFALMALLPEYIAILTYFYTGFSIPPDRGVPAAVEIITESADKSGV